VRPRARGMHIPHAAKSALPYHRRKATPIMFCRSLLKVACGACSGQALRGPRASGKKRNFARYTAASTGLILDQCQSAGAAGSRDIQQSSAPPPAAIHRQQRAAVDRGLVQGRIVAVRQWTGPNHAHGGSAREVSGSRNDSRPKPSRDAR